MSKISIAYPTSGLTPAISVINMTTEVQDFSGTMTEIGTSKVYIYEFSEVSGTDYVYTITTTGYDVVSDSLFYTATGGGSGGGLTTEEHDKLMNIVTGGGSGNMTGVTSSISSLRTLITKKIEEEHDKTRELIVSENNDTNSHIELAKSNVIDTIKEIEIPEAKLEEKEAKKAVKLLATLDKKVSTYIDSEKKEKEEIGAIASEFTRMEMEDAKKEKEKEIEEKRKEEEEKKMEEESDKKLLEEIQKEFDSQEEQEKEQKKKELEKELEEALKEAKEIEQELNSIK